MVCDVSFTVLYPHHSSQDRFGVASDHRGANKGPTSVQTFWNITIALKEPDLDFGKSMNVTAPAYADKPVTIDGGKNWLISYIRIPPELGQ
jgi:hypothetical protein